ncbi:MAG: hypothetical protein RLZZ296_236 [Pseudomonadota bacterium]
MTLRCLEQAAPRAVCGVHFSVCLLAAVLATGLVHAAGPAPSQAQAVTARSYTVQRGDTLDRVIQHTLPDSPLKMELLRKAFVGSNPQAFVSGNVSRLRAGVVLQVPDHTKLLRSTVMPLLDGADAAAMAGEGRSYNASDRRSWVRFP